MNTAAPAARLRDSHRFLIGIVLVLALALIWFVGSKSHYLTDYSLSFYSKISGRAIDMRNRQTELRDRHGARLRVFSSVTVN